MCDIVEGGKYMLNSHQISSSAIALHHMAHGIIDLYIRSCAKVCIMFFKPCILGSRCFRANHCVRHVHMTDMYRYSLHEHII